MLNPGFEDLTKRSLLARFIKKFPKIQSLLDGERLGILPLCQLVCYR
jgi:hypothetical protein